MTASESCKNSVSTKKSIREILFGTCGLPKILPVCEHLAGNEKFISKALTLQEQLGYSFDITCDLEDGAPVGDELACLDLIVAALRDSKEKARLGVRVHHVTHELFEREIEVLVSSVGDKIAYITIPKVLGVSDVKNAISLINKYRRQSKVANQIPLHILVETPAAVREAALIAELQEVETLDFGLMDFISEHQGAISANCMRSPQQFEHALLFRARTEIAAAALGFGKVATHNVCVAIESPISARDDARRARQEFGYQRMWSIHPAQIEPIIEGMRESSSEVEKAKEIILRAISEKWGPISYKNQLQDRASYRYYWLILERAHAAGIALSGEIEEYFLN
jgi:citrate lyase subunit beta / citryl-CoA lyase